MHNLFCNFTKFLDVVQTALGDRLDEKGNLQFYPHAPKMSDSRILALGLCAESLSIDSENLLFSKLASDYPGQFPILMDRSNYNRRRRRLQPVFDEVRLALEDSLRSPEQITFVVDSMPLPVCHMARHKASRICKEDRATAPEVGYSAISRTHFYGYRLHLIITGEGLPHDYQMLPANVHDISALKRLDASSLQCGILLGDKGYISARVQTDLFETHHLCLFTPARRNSAPSQEFTPLMRKTRKRVETAFSQASDQFLMKRNYAKSFKGFLTRIANKIAAFIALQFLNSQNNRPLNHIKHALAA